MKHSIVTFLFFFISLHSFSQQVDRANLKNILEKSSKFESLKKFDSAIFYANDLLSISKSIKDTLYIIKAYNKLAKCHRLNNSPFDAVKYYNESNRINLKTGDTITAIKKLRYIASIQKRLGSYNSSENTAIDALELTKRMPDSIATAHKLALYNNLGITTNAQYNYEDALKWYNSALLLSKDSLKIITIKNNIALTNIKLGYFRSAIDSLLKILELPVIEENRSQKAKIIDNIGYAKSRIDDPLAEQIMMEALAIRKDIKDFSGQFASHIHLTKHYEDRKQTYQALNHARQAYKIAVKQNSANSQVEALSYLIRLEDDSKEKAIEYQRLTDSITKARLQSKNQFAKIKYETDKNREKILELNAEKAEDELKLEKETSNRNLSLFISFLLVISVLFIIYYWRQRIKTASFNATTKTENRISKKVHDEMANDISDIKTLVKNHVPGTNPAKKQIMNMLDTSYLSARDIATETGGIIFGDSFGETLRNLLMQHNDDNVKIIASISTIDTIEIDQYKKNAIYRTLQELMVNMNKHSQATKVTVAYKKNGRNNEIQYTDDGIGADGIKKNRGLQNAVTRMQDIGGSFNFETSEGNGFKANLKFKT